MEIAYGVVSRRSKPHPPLVIVRKLPKPIAESRNKIFGNLAGNRVHPPNIIDYPRNRRVLTWEI